jgi:hypothetical protein
MEQMININKSILSNIRNQIFSLLVLSSISSCNVGAKISILKDGSANVEFDSPKVINPDTNIVSKPLDLSMEILNKTDTLYFAQNYYFERIDSLTSNYFGPFNKGYLNFKYIEDSLLFIFTNPEIKQYNDSALSLCCDQYLILSFENKIQNIKCSNSRVNWNKKKNIVKIYRSGYDKFLHKKSKEPLLLYIYLYP